MGNEQGKSKSSSKKDGKGAADKEAGAETAPPGRKLPRFSALGTDTIDKHYDVTDKMLGKYCY